jgi:hydroxymethylbilane synthase
LLDFDGLGAPRGRAIDAAMIGADAGNEIVLKLPHGVAGLM